MQAEAIMTQQDRRSPDGRIDEIQNIIIEMQKLQQEIHQRQLEKTIPVLEKLEKCLYGNGEAGLLEEHVACKEQMKAYGRLSDKVGNILITLIGSIAAFIFGYGIMYFKVEHLWKLVVK